MIDMKANFLLFMCFWGLVGSVHCSDVMEDRIKLFSHTRRSGFTNEWWLPMSRFKALPKWRPAKEDVPLSLERALTIATGWVKAKRDGAEPELESITIRSIHPDQEEFRHTFYYRIIFGVWTFDRMACIVLMDGTVLEPENPRISTNKPREPINASAPARDDTLKQVGFPSRPRK